MNQDSKLDKFKDEINREEMPKETYSEINERKKLISFLVKPISGKKNVVDSTAMQLLLLLPIITKSANNVVDPNII